MYCSPLLFDICMCNLCVIYVFVCSLSLCARYAAASKIIIVRLPHCNYACDNKFNLIWLAVRPFMETYSHVLVFSLVSTHTLLQIQFRQSCIFLCDLLNSYMHLLSPYMNGPRSLSEMLVFQLRCQYSSVINPLLYALVILCCSCVYNFVYK